MCYRFKHHKGLLPPIYLLEKQMQCHMRNLIWEDSRWPHLTFGIGMSVKSWGTSPNSDQEIINKIYCKGHSHENSDCDSSAEISSLFMESRILLLCSRGPITGLCPKTEESSPNPHTLFVINLFSYRKKVNLWQACSAFYVVWVNLASFGLHAGNMKLNTRDEEWITIIIIHLCI